MLTYSLVGADSRWFEVDTNSGQLKVKALLDHDSALDSNDDNRYEFRLWVSDRKDAETASRTPRVDDSIDVTVAVTNLNEPPKFDTATIELKVDENTSTNQRHRRVQLRPPTRIPPRLAYSLAGPDSRWFDVDASSGQLKTSVALFDREAPVDDDGDNVYDVTVQVSATARTRKETPTLQSMTLSA